LDATAFLLTFAERLDRVRERIVASCARAGRQAESVRLVAVSKTFTAARVKEAMAAGLTDFGENRVQEAADKIAAVGAGATWHLIGHLQGNKAKKAAEIFDWVQSVDSIEIAEDLSRRAVAAARYPEILIELNLSGEAAKTGMDPARLDEALARIQNLPALSLRGLMTMGPYGAPRDVTRACFRQLRDTLEASRKLHVLADTFSELSMGMSDDFETAIEEGSTIVRIGRALFGDR